MIIYTCNTNNYIEDLQAPAWVEVITDVEDLGDPVRSSRKDKILCPFYDEDSVYVDASKVHLLNDQFLELSKEILSKEHFFVMQHPHEYTYLEECAEYVYRGWVDGDTLCRYTAEVKNVGYDFGKHFSPLCTILWRKSGMQEFNQTWWDWYLRGGVRDQLSFSTALQMTRTKFETLPSVNVISRFSDASPDGIWWQNRQGDYKYFESKNPIEVVKELSRISGLSYFRYRTLEYPVEYSDRVDISFGKVSGYIPFGRTPEGKNYDHRYVNSSAKRWKN